MRSGTGILPVRFCGIGILPMFMGWKPMPRRTGFSHTRSTGGDNIFEQCELKVVDAAQLGIGHDIACDTHAGISEA